MKVTAQQDRERGAGHALLYITGLDQPERWTAPAFLIRRSDGKSLGQGEWHMGDMPLAPDGSTATGEALRLNLGPEVVDLMEPGNYKITLSADGLAPQEANFAWGYIPASPLKGRHRPQEEEPEAPPPPPEPAPPVEEEQTLEGGGPAAAASQPEAKAPPREPDAKPDKKAFPWLLIPALVVLLGLGGWLTWTYLSPEPSVVPPPPAREQAQKALSENVSPQRAMELAKQIDEQGEDLDSAFLLYDYAAEKGVAAAALRVGNFYDPTYDGPSGSIEKDPAQAFRWYGKAREGGVETAQQDLDRLQAWVKERADQGDAQAKALLERWQ